MLTMDLRIFMATASTCSLSAAGRRLDLTPMQVSRRIAALEQELDIRLFHRTTRSVSLTAEGEAFLPYASSITEAEDGARNQLRSASTGATGVLRLTAPTVFAQSIVLPLLPRLLMQHPNLQVDLDVSDRVIDLVGHGMDLALRIAPLGDSDLVARKLAANPRLICAAPRYLHQYGYPRTLKDLDAHQCVVLQAVPKWSFIVGGELKSVRVRGRVSTSSVEAARAAAILGLGLTMLTYCDVFQQLKEGSLVQVTLQDAATEDLSIWAIMPSRRYIPVRVKVFIDALIEELPMH